MDGGTLDRAGCNADPYGLQTRFMPTLRDRLAAMLDESAGEVTALESKRQALRSERDAEIAAIRERYAGRIADIETELETVQRVRRALEGPKPKAPKEPPKPKRAIAFRPGNDKLLAVLRAIESGADQVPSIDDAVSFSRGTVENSLIALRDDGWIRLSGERRVQGANVKARTYALTPDGREAITELAGRLNGATA